MKGDVEARKDTKGLHGRLKIFIFLQPQHCESWHRQTAGITFLQAWAQSSRCSLRLKETLNEADVFKKYVSMCVCLLVEIKPGPEVPLSRTGSRLIEGY